MLRVLGRGPVRTAGLAVLLVSAITGCGGSDSESAATASPTPAGDASPAAGEVKKLEAGTEQIAATTPLPARPKPGRTFVYLKCQVPQCALLARGVKQAVTDVGWRYEEIGYDDANPATLIPAMKRALSRKPVAISFTGTPQQIWAGQIPAFEKAGVAIIPLFVGPVTISKAVPANIAGPPNDEASARDIAQWVAADSGGKGKVLVQSIGSYQAVQTWAKAVESEVPKACPDCEVEVISSSGEQANSGTATSAIVSELRRKSDIGYFVGYNGAFFTGLETSVRNANLDVKVGGLFPLPQNVTDIQRGSGGAFLAESVPYSGWLAVDAALRLAAGAPQLPDEQSLLPRKLVTKASAETSDGNFEQPADYKDQFRKLWKVR